MDLQWTIMPNEGRYRDHIRFIAKAEVLINIGNKKVLFTPEAPLQEGEEKDSELIENKLKEKFDEDYDNYIFCQSLEKVEVQHRSKIYTPNENATYSWGREN